MEISLSLENFWSVFRAIELLINIFSKGVNPKLILNPILAIEFLSFQISFLLEMSNFLTLAIGFLLTLVPLIFGYIISKEFFMKNELF